MRAAHIRDLTKLTCNDERLATFDLYLVARFLGFIVEHFRREPGRQDFYPGALLEALDNIRRQFAGAVLILPFSRIVDVANARFSGWPA